MYTIIRYTQCAKTMSDSECSSVTDTDLSSVCSDSTFSGESINKCLYDSQKCRHSFEIAEKVLLFYA